MSVKFAKTADLFAQAKNLLYPDAIVEGIRNLNVKPEPGDVVTFWADRLHAVNGIKSGTRINSTFFSALKDSEEATILLWS